MRGLPGVRSSGGAHRAPGSGTLSRTRQSVVLGALVVAGLFAVILPMQQRGGDTTVDPIAADHAVTATSKPKTKPQDTADAPAGKPVAGDADQTAGAPEAAGSGKSAGPTHAVPAATPGASATPTAAAQTVLVPAGDGPGQSLRTTGSSTVALTFDDGPDPEQTPKLLAMLAKYRVKATFCLVGQQVKRHPDIVRDIVEAGHTLCNHTWDHSLTIGKDKPEKIRADLARTNAAIRAAVPGAEIPFFRAPGGNFTDLLVQTAYADGMTSLYWEVDPADWDHPEGEKDDTHIERVIKSVQKHTRPGAIVLSHDFNQPDTIKAYETLIPWLQTRFTLGLPGIPPAPTAPAAPASSAPAAGAAGVDRPSPSAPPSPPPAS
ncbi:polysaccharide deacetylase family protein [Symbioplanes lichenis]|uniref:polysaccharide deacetylase family protein n=1 Tax=Symbioplanes lichenis TaxID=1629072 RepID=UPI002738C7FA|nr:polysaccharide deacetylase family protein [Actinoplanes lichenis]